MQTSTNFALALTPARVFAAVPGGWLYSTMRRGRYQMSIGQMLDIDVETEHDLWAEVQARAPSALPALESSNDLFNEGIATRARLFLENSPVVIQSMEEDFHRQMLTICHTVLESMDARVSNKLKVRRLTPSRGLSYLEVKPCALIPHLGTERESMSILMLPGALDNHTFQVQVRVRSNGMRHYVENKTRLNKAFERLNGMGIVVEDILQGTALYLH